MVAFDRIVLPALRAYAPDFILVSSGFDAEYCDPLSSMMLHSDSFGAMAAQLHTVAKALCHGRIVFCHEGGYSETYVPFCGAAVIQALMNLKSSIVKDPMLFEIKDRPGQCLQPHQDALLDQVINASPLLKTIPTSI
jgi:acetoin utilization deacetylase AcuC-like enzyme